MISGLRVASNPYGSRRFAISYQLPNTQNIYMYYSVGVHLGGERGGCEMGEVITRKQCS